MRFSYSLPACSSFLFLLAACASGGDPTGTDCTTALDCPGGRCVDGECVPDDGVDAGGTDDDAGGATPDAGLPDSGPPPPMCTGPTECDDSSVCTTDDCFDGSCAYTPIDCDDGDACTTDACDPATGCTSTALSCDDGDACTVDSCDSATGCSNVPVEVPGGSCATPIDISAGGTFTGDSTCAASDFSGVCLGAAGPDVAFVLDLAEESDVSLDASGSSFSAVLFVGSSCGDAGTACDSSGSAAADLTLPAGRHYVGLDGRASSDAGSWSLDVSVTPVVREETLTFPDTGDTRYSLYGDRFWNSGDYVQGTRSTSLSSISSADLTLSVSPNGLTCDNQDMQLLINGTPVGSVIITPSSSTVTQSFSFAPISGPTYTLRLQTTRTVSSGCGSAGLPNGTSTLVIRN